MLDDMRTWSKLVRGYVDEQVPQFLARSDIVEDARILATQGRVRAYHLTRLLEHEVDSIRRNGLALASAGLVEARIADAVVHRCLTRRDARYLLVRFADRDQHWESRANLLYVLASLKPLRGISVSGTHYLREWGGEILSHCSSEPKFRDLLETLGTPSIIKMDLALVGDHIVPGVTARLLRVRTKRGGSVTIALDRPIAAGEIVSILQPGDPEYDNLRTLPRT